VLLALVAGLIMFVRRHGRRRRPHSKLTAALAEEALDAVLCPLPPAYTAESEKTVEHTLLSAHRLLEWRVDESDIHWMTDELTRGSRYVVDLAVFRHRFRHDGRFRRELFPGPIAVKRLRIDDRDDPRARDRLLTDAAVLSRVRHPQILSLLGVRYSRALGVQALVEFMEGGTLRAWLSGLLDAGESSAWTPIKAQLALDVADALAFAHSHAPPLVHARLRSDKVFLTGDARAKLGDWRAYEPSGSGGGDHDDGMGTVLLPRSGAQSGERWLAPEVLAGSAAHSPASDVFALGVLLSELDTHRPPYEGGGELIAHGGAVSVLVASGRLRPAFSAGVDGLPRALRAMAQRCLALDPRARPAAPEVVRAFRAAAEREA
jgi:serine/threonine protein kinase